jgi:hypothetical protein
MSSRNGPRREWAGGAALLGIALLVAVCMPAISGCGAAETAGMSPPGTSAASSSSTETGSGVVPSSASPQDAVTVPARDGTSSAAPLTHQQLDQLPAPDVVRTYFLSTDFDVRLYLSSPDLQKAMDDPQSGWREYPGEVSDVIVAGPLPNVESPFIPPAGIDLPSGPRVQWAAQSFFAVNYVSPVPGPSGEPAGARGACVIVGQQTKDGPWKIVTVNAAPAAKELPAAEQQPLNALSATETARTYFQSCDFDIQYYLSAPRQRGMLLMAVRENEHPGDATDVVVEDPVAGSSSMYSTAEWPTQIECVVTYSSRVASSIGEPPGKRMWFVIVGRQGADSPWKVLEVGSGP